MKALAKCKLNASFFRRLVEVFMEYVIKDLTRAEIDIMESSDLEWCPYIAPGHTIVCCHVY